MIVKNEEENLPRCLSSVQNLVDEMIIVDTGSTDKTVEIAKSFGAKVFYFQWINDFSAARNFGLNYAKGDWLLIMDADDELEKEGVEKIRILAQDKKMEAYIVETISYLGENSGVDYSISSHPRIIRNRKEYRFTGKIHEQILVNILKYANESQIANVDGLKFYHYGYLKKHIEKQQKRVRNLEILQEQAKEIENIESVDYKFLHYNIGTEYLAQGKPLEAWKEYQISIQGLESNYAFYPHLISKMLIALTQLGQIDKALEIIQENQKKFPNFLDLYYSEGTIYHMKKQYTKAIRSFQKCLELRGKLGILILTGGMENFRAHMALGSIYEEIGDDQKAVDNYNKALEYNPNFIDPVYRVAAIIKRSYSIEDILKTMERYFDLSKPSSLGVLADILYSIKLYEKCLQYVLEALEKSPGITDNLCYLAGMCYIYLGNFEKAKQFFALIKCESSYYTHSLENLCLVCWALREYKEVQLFIASLEKSEGNQEIIKIYKEINQFLQGKRKGAILKEIRKKVNYWALYFNRILDKILDYKMGELLSKLQGLENEIAEISKNLNLIKVYLKHNRATKAWQYAQQLLKEKEYSKELFGILAQCLQKTNYG